MGGPRQACIHYASCLPSPKHNRFGGAHQHHYLLDFFQAVAECYHSSDRAGNLVVDLLKLKVPKLFAVEQEEKDEEVRRKFSTFLQDYICRCDLKPTILKEMPNILVRVKQSCSLYTLQNHN